MIKYIGIAAIVFMLAGCTIKDDGTVVGKKTGLNYTKIYKVAKDGVTTYMTEEQIKEAKLDMVDDAIIKAYEIAEEHLEE
jgi:hypothetical protein